MSKSRTQKIFIRVFVVLCLGVFTGPYVFAEEFMSTGFRALNPLTNSFGGYGTSTSFSSVVSGGQTVTGESTSTNFILHMGFLYFDSFEPKSQNWRWYSDEENETPTSALAAENVAPINIEDQDIIKLRITVLDTADIGATNQKMRLQFSTSSDFSTGGYDLSEDAQCVGSSKWCYADGAGVDNAILSTKILSDADTCSGSVGDGCGTHNEFGTSTSAFTHPKSAATEYEFTIQQSGAAINTVYFFRLVNRVSSTTIPINVGETYPSLVSGGSTLEFTIGGLSSGTTTEGVTMDITTTPTSVPFGALSISAQTKGAQRLTVSTNGTEGYKIYAYQRQGLLADTGGTIDPVSGTNPSPLSWTGGCPGAVEGCYGYHSGEDVLEGGSTRFAANDTFAQFTPTPYEIAYNNGPVQNKMTDIVYQVEVRDEQQNGNYSTNIVYIVTPVF